MLLPVTHPASDKHSLPLWMVAHPLGTVPACVSVYLFEMIAHTELNFKIHIPFIHVPHSQILGGNLLAIAFMHQ